MNILSYDFHSAFEPAVNHHAPLYSMEEESEYNFESDLNIVSPTKNIDIETFIYVFNLYGYT